METQCSSRVPLSFTTDSIKHNENSSEKIISHYEPLILEKNMTFAFGSSNDVHFC